MKNKDIDNYILKIFNTNSSKKKEINDFNNKERAENTIDETSEKWNLNSKITNLFETKIESDTKLKRRYAMALIILLIITIVALNVWFVMKGLGILNFSDTTFNLFITGGLAEIFVLIKIIVKYLFDDNLTELLKLILDRNNQENKSKNNNFKKNNKNKNDDSKITQDKKD
nr:MAG TPA: hypothetical protein [Caudoviricetes sp.]